MSCNVIRNNNGSINTVLNKENQESRLFQQINNDLFLGGTENALTIYHTSLTDEIASMYEGVETSASIMFEETNEPRMFYQAENGKVFNNMEDALIETTSGNFNIGFINPSTGKLEKTASFNTNASPLTSALAGAVKEGMIETEKVYDKKTGESKILGKGEYTRKVSAEVFSDWLVDEAGIASHVNEAGEVKILSITSPYITVYKTYGNVKVLSKTEAKKEVEKTNTKNKGLLFTQTEDLLNKKFEGGTKAVNNLSYHQNNLEGFLKSLGFTVTSLNSYKQSYKMRHGSDIDVSGLVDIANRVVAIVEGVNLQEVLTEEVAHIAIEAYNDQASIADALVEVVNTQEYRDYAEQYRNKYGDEYQGVELEEQVRKEILGKILARELLSDSATEVNRNLWERFVEYIRSRFKPRYRTTIDVLTKNIKDDINSGNITSFNNPLTNKTGVYFSLGGNNAITKDIEKAFDLLTRVSRSARKNSDNTIISVKKPNIKNESLKNLEAINNINDYIKTLKANLDAIAIKNRVNDSGVNDMSAIDYVIFHDLYDKTFPILENFSKWLRENSFKPSEKAISEKITEDLVETMQKISDLHASVTQNYSDIFVEQMNLHIINNPNLSEKDKEEALKEFSRELKDVSSFSKIFTNPSASPSPYIRLIGKILSDMDSRVAFEYKEFFQKATNNFENKGWRKFQKSVIGKDKKGKNSFYLEDGVNHADAENAVREDIVKYILSIAPKSKKEKLLEDLNTELPEDVLENALKENKKELTEEITKQFQKIQRDSKLDNYTSYYTKEKVEEDLRLNEIAEVSEETYLEEESFRRQLNEVRSKYFRRNGGVFDINQMSESDRLLLNRIESTRRVKRAPIDSTGEVFEGLSLLSWEEMTPEDKEVYNKINRSITGSDLNEEDINNTTFIVLNQGKTLQDLSSEARYSLDIFKLNLARRSAQKQRGESFKKEASQDFFDAINSQKAEDKIDFIFNNTDIEYTEEFYDYGAEGREEFLRNVQEQIDNETDITKKYLKEQALERYKQLVKNKAQITKAYRSKEDRTEIEVNNLTASARKLWIDIDEELNSIRRQLGFFELGQNESLSDRVLASSFKPLQKVSGKSEYEFALKHMSDNRRTKVEVFKKALEYSNDPTRSGYLDSKIEEEADRIIEKYEIEPEVGETRDKFIERVYTAYAKDNLASYFYGSRLKSLEEVKRQMEEDVISGKIDAIELLDEDFIRNNYSPYFKLSPKYMWNEQDNSSRFKDPEYNPIKGSQPRMSKFKNVEFFNKYGISEEDYNKVADVTEMKASNNVNEFEFLQFLVGNNKEANSEYNTSTNIMLRPQISKSSYEKVKGAYNFSNAYKNGKESLRDVFSDRVDEMDYGDSELQSAGIKSIPKMHRRRLENADVLTENLFEASMILMKSSKDYTMKSETRKIVDAVVNQATNREFSKGNLKKGIRVRGEVSETVKALTEIADHYIYGIKQSRKLEFDIGGLTIDLTRAMTKFQKYSSHVNLAFGAFVPLTSLTTGIFGNIENRIAGDQYANSSLRRGNRQLAKDAPGYVLSEGKINNTNRLASIMDFFGMSPANGRLENSKATRLERVLWDSAFLTDNIANVPVLSVPLYATLYDTRYFESPDGTKKGYMSYNGFKAYQKTLNPSIKNQDIKNMWENIADDSFMNALEINSKTGAIKIKETVKNRIPQEDLNRIIQDISSKSRIIAQQVDGVITESDRLMAQRDVLLNTVMQHSGFLFINLAKAFKKRGYNYHTGKIEEGTYTTLAKIAGNLIKERGNFSKVFSELEDFQKGNFKRVSLQMATTMLLLYMAQMLKASDDPDDSVAEDMMRIITYRTYGEIKDLSPIGMVKTIYSKVQDPVVFLGTLETIGKTASSVVSEDGIDGKKLRQLLFMKSYDQLKDIHTYTNSWLYNKRTEMSSIYNYKPNDE